MMKTRVTVLVALASLVLSGSVAFGQLSKAGSVMNNTPQRLPFTQNWSDTAKISTNDDWSAVQGIVGYRGDGGTVATGVDPQTVVADLSDTVDVVASQTNPNTAISGGVYEFHLTDPVVALQGSGTADAPNIVISTVTTGFTNIVVRYNLRDIDGSTDNSVQPVALQYRVGTIGDFTNVPAGYVADASTGPSLATQVTPVSATLPSDAGNQSVVQIRVITTNAVGNDEWIGIDDISITGTSAVRDTVTFRVNMSVKWQEGKFSPSSGDVVRVVGSFNNWSATDTTVLMSRNSGSDSIWVSTQTIDSSWVHDDTIYYKYVKTNRGGDWESVSNRVYALVNGSHTLPIVYFDNDSTVNALVNVTFRVNMAIKMRELTFQPSSGDTVRVVGSFQGWNTADTTVRMAKGTSDSVFSATIIANESDKLFYKFYKKPNRGGLDWEGDQPTGSKNREYTVPVGGGSTAVSWFDNDSVFNQTVITSITWQTDVAPYMTLGWFDATKDTVEVRGGFTGWSGQKMQPLVLTPSIWQYQSTGLLLPVGDEMQYKFYLRLDSAGAVTRFPGLVWGGSSDNRDGFLYEHPAQRGDGNNQYTVQNQTSQAPQRHWFSGINPQGLLGANDSVTVTLKVNMGPATRYSNAFNYTSDTLFVVWQDALWRSAQEKNQGVAFPQVVKMTRQSGTDSVYSLSFKVKGKTHYNMQYTYRFKKADGTTVDQGGGLGGQNPFITRFIQKVSGAWPATHTAPTDAWQKDAPLPGETAQFTTDVPEAPNQPLTYELYQNYPNPFNPVTMIRYTLPQQATVKLRVYNILGQQVAELVNTLQPAGAHTVGFDAHRLSTGVYFYRIEAGSFVDVKKMILLK